MPDKELYKGLLSEIIAKQAIILGPDIAVLKARSITGIQVSDDGKVTDFQGDGNELVEHLIDKYVELSGMIVKNAMSSILMKYQSMRNE